MEASERLIGRADELIAVARVLAGRQDRGAHLVAISGEPGIGKTRLLGVVADAAERAGHLVLKGRATEFEHSVPFAVLVDALDDYLGSLNTRVLEPLAGERLTELARVFPSLVDFASERRGLEAERFRLHRAIRALLELLALRKPLLLVLDDVHWADPASLEFLLHSIGHPPKRGVVLAIAYRPAQVSNHLASELAAAANDGTATIVELGPLTREETAELLGSKLDAEQLQTVFVQSGGNPFFAQQLARSPLFQGALSDAPDISEGVPRAVVEAIDRELQLLTDQERLLLAGAAVTGDPFEPELAGVGAGIQETEALPLLDALLRRDLVRPSEVPTRFRFRHPIMRRAVYESAGPGWRLAAHRRLAARLRERGATASELAHHVEAAAQPGDRDAIAVLTEAGRAITGRAPAVAARRFSAALRLLAPDDAGPRVELLVPLAISLGAAGELESSHDALLEALSLLPAEQSAARVRMVGFCSAIEHLLGRHEQAHARLLREQAMVHDQHSPEAVALAIERSTDGQWITNWDEMTHWAERAMAGADALGSRPLLLAAEVLVCFAYSIVGRIAEAEHHRGAAGALFDALDDEELAERLDAPFWLGYADYHLERYEDGVRHFERGIAVSRATGQSQFLTEMRSGLAWCLTALGRLEEAIAVSEDALEAARLAANAQSVGVALWVRCWLARTLGDLELGRRCGEESVAIAGALDENIILWVSRAHLAAIYVEAGEHEHSIRELERAGAPDFTNFAVERRPLWYEVLTRAALGLGRLDEAEAWVARAETIAETYDVPVAAAAARRARAYLLLAQGEPAAAAERALAAAEAQQSREARIEAARSRVLAGRALAAAGDRERAVIELECAHDELDHCGAERWRDEAARELRRLGVRVVRAGTRGGGAGVASLSGRELEVAELVAAGKTNKEIAAALFVSEKTVEKHLARVFEKLEVSGRRAVAARLAEETSTPSA